MTIHITLKLFATLQKYTPAHSERYPITPGMSVADVVRDLKIPDRDVKLIFVNSIRKGRDTPLADGDRLGIFPPVGGG